MGVVERNKVTIKGQGSTTIVFAHGYGCDQNMWRFIVPAFEKEYKIVLFDLTGSGKSDISQYNSDKYCSLKGYAEDVIEICEELNLTDVIFIGHSVSCMIGLLAAVRHPNLFRNLIMVAPSPCYINDKNYIGGFEKEDIEQLLDMLDSNYLGWTKYITPVIMGPDQSVLTEELEVSFCSTNPDIAREFAHITFLGDNRGDLHKLTIPALILQCTDDVIAPCTVGEYLKEKINNSTLELLNVTGHCPHLSHPDQTIKAIQNFLKVS